MCVFKWVDALFKQMSENTKSCYEECNERFQAMAPGRLFCKKGCDSEEEKIGDCKKETCNKLCIKSDQGEKKLWFQFLLRAPERPDHCLEACLHGCNHNHNYRN